MEKVSKIKKFLLFFLILPCLLLFSACNSDNSVVAKNNYIVDISKTDTQGLNDIYTITYSDGTTSSFTIKNGENGKNGQDGKNANISLSDAYESAVENGFNGTYIEFLKEFLQTDNIDNDIAAANLGLMSAVSVDSSYEYTTQGYVGNPFSGYELKTITQTVSQAGSGVIYTLDKQTGDAYIITNYHVVYASYLNNVLDTVKVNIYGHQNKEEAIEASYIGGSMTYDIAVLKISGSTLLKNSDCVAVCERFIDSNKVSVGTTAIAVGNAAGLGISVTSGIVSVDSEYISMKSVDNSTTITFRTMRIDTAINGGNSGGALYDNNGNVIGIVNARISVTSIENIAYAIPSNIAKRVADNIIYNHTNGNGKQVLKFNFGIKTSANSSSSVLNNDHTITTTEQVSISEISANSFALNELSILTCDTIKSITVDGTKQQITRTFDVSDLALNIRPNCEIIVDFVRNGEQKTSTGIASSNYFEAIV